MSVTAQASQEVPADQAQHEDQGEPGERTFFLRRELEEHGGY